MLHVQPSKGDWSSGMIPALGAGGHGFDSRTGQNDGVHIRGGIRTRDLLLRRQTRYPLRYTDSALQIDGAFVTKEEAMFRTCTTFRVV